MGPDPDDTVRAAVALLACTLDGDTVGAQCIAATTDLTALVHVLSGMALAGLRILAEIDEQPDPDAWVRGQLAADLATLPTA